MDRNRTQSLRLASLALAAAATTVTGQVAVAQEAGADEGLTEVVITTARQRAEALTDVPAAITAITAETLEAANVQRAGDFIRLTPGVSFVQSAEVADGQVNIRGINGARDAENSFALIIDGILVTNPAALNREYTDLKQMEIVKGPQGAIYGRNAASGAIIVTTTKPGNEFAGNAKIGYGEDNTVTGALTVGGPLGDRMGWKLGADYRSTDGFYRNTFLDRKVVDDFEGWNVSGRLVVETSDTSSLDIKARVGEVDAAAIAFNAAFQLPGFTFSGLPNAQLFNENVNTHKFDFVPNIDPFNKQETVEVSAKFDQELSFGTLTAWALYSKIDNAFGTDGTSGAFGFFNNDPQCQNTTAAFFNSGQQLPPPQIIFFAAMGVPPAAIFGPYTPTACDGTQYQERNQEDVSFELRLASSGDQRVRWLTGLYYLNIDREVGVNTGIDRGQGIVPQLYVPPGGANPTEQLVWDNFETDVYAVFGNLAIDVTDSLEASLALRYDREERTSRSLVPTSARTQYIDFTPDGIAGGNAFLNPGLDPTINPGGLQPQDRTFSQLQPKLSITYEYSPDLTLYTTWGIGFKSGGFNNGGSNATVDIFINCLIIAANNNCTNTNGTPYSAAQRAGIQRSVLVRDSYDKEKSSSFEVGAKGKLLDGRVSWDVSLYDTKVDDMQFFEFLVGQFGLLRVVNNIDEVSVQGFEIAANARLTDNLTLAAGFGRVMSEIDANTSRPNSVGNKSPYTPDYTATAGVELDVPVSDNGWRVQGSAYWNLVGPTWFHVIQSQDNPTLFGVPGNFTLSQRDKYTTVDARVAVVNDNWTFALVGKNVTDTKYLAEVIPAPEFGGDFIHPGTERRLSLEVGYKF
jgi:iron complex outermembrane receptor protein